MPAAVQSQNGQRKRSDPRRESVGGYPRWLRGYLRGLATLPEPGSDLARDFGPDIYRRMMLDSTVSAGVRTLSLASISQGDHLSPVVTEKDKPDFDRAQEIARFCAWNLDAIRPQKTDVYLDLLTAMAHGHRKAELVYRDAERGELAQFPGLARGLVLKSIKPKPNSVLSFVTDEFLNVVGYYARPNGLAGYGAVTPEPKDILPPEKFAVLSWMPIDSDPRGQSILDCVYSPWWDLQMVVGEFLKFLAQFAGPSIAALLRENAQPAEPETDPATGEYLPPKSRVAQVQETLQKWMSGTAAAFQDVEKLIPVEMRGEGQAFLSAMADCRERIREGLTLQSMAGSQAPHGTQALGSVHQDMLAYTIGYARAALASVLKDDILTQLVLYNYGESARHLVPDVSFTSGGPEDLAGMLKALATCGYSLHRSQFPAIDAANGQPPRADNWMEDEPEPVVPPGTDPAQDDEERDQ